MAEQYEEDVQDLGIESAEVVTKYVEAGRLAQVAAAKVAAAAVAGATVTDLCKLGDASIQEQVKSMYNKKVQGKTIPKGVAFPTCVSVNNVVCHNSPLSSDPVVTLKDGDVVKIDLGVQLDGYPAFCAKTVVVGASAAAPATGRAADAILAAHTALEVALRLVKPGEKNTTVTAAIQKVAEEFGCQPVQGMLSYQISRFSVDGQKSIIQNPPIGAQKHQEDTFEVNEIYAIDILISTGTGKTKEAEIRPTVFQRGDEVYSLKLKAARELVQEVNQKFLTFPFVLRACEHEVKAKMGVTECVTHRVLVPYPVLAEKEGEVVAQFKSVLLLKADGVQRVSNPAFDAATVKSEKSLKDPELLKVLATSLSSKKKKAAKAASAAEGASA